MNSFKFLVFSFVFLSSLVTKATVFSGVNRIEFNDPQYNKAFVGNGFLIEFENKTYAVTVKHTLLEAKTPKLTHIDFSHLISAWYIHPLREPQRFVKLGRLINRDPKEPIDMKILQKDWLVFEVEENNSDLSILKLRTSQIQPGETLTAYGCSYAKQRECYLDDYQFNFIENDQHNLRLTMGDRKMGALRGLSGSPVLDKDNQVVGIVSNILKKKSAEGFDFAPANLNYLLSVLKANSKAIKQGPK
ncbi:trypsin-like peptidase domain-containing protein [Aliikangiella marina]|nr:trypsin-like peptidase domain-containing protein [Aliikangiella marina]